MSTPRVKRYGSVEKKYMDRLNYLAEQAMLVVPEPAVYRIDTGDRKFIYYAYVSRRGPPLTPQELSAFRPIIGRNNPFKYLRYTHPEVKPIELHPMFSRDCPACTIPITVGRNITKDVWVNPKRGNTLIQQLPIRRGAIPKDFVLVWMQRRGRQLNVPLENGSLETLWSLYYEHYGRVIESATLTLPPIR